MLFTVVLFAFNARSNPYLAGTLVTIYYYPTQEALHILPTGNKIENISTTKPAPLILKHFLEIDRHVVSCNAIQTY